MNIGKVVRVAVVLVPVAMLGELGGCSTISPDDEQRDSGVERREECTRKVENCMNRCMKAGMVGACGACCQRNGGACDANESYGFSSCTDEE